MSESGISGQFSVEYDVEHVKEGGQIQVGPVVTHALVLLPIYAYDNSGLA